MSNAPRQEGPKMYIPWHHPPKSGPRSPTDEETHGGISNGIPGSSHKQDNRGIKWIQLKSREGNDLDLTYTEHSSIIKYNQIRKYPVYNPEHIGMLIQGDL